MVDELLSVKNLSVDFERYGTTFGKSRVMTVENVDLTIKRGEIVAVVGASGSGKSLLAHSILGILPKNAQIGGEIFFKGDLLTPMRQKQTRGREICLIPQSINYLDPVLKIKKQLLLNRFTYKDVLDALEKLDLEESVLELYPHQLSGGMARRILFATALLTQAELIVADEPTPGMHLKQAISALSLLKQMACEEGKAVILITHDIDLAVEFADRITFFYEGKTIESMTPQAFQKGPTDNWNPFTKKMWRALPQNEFLG